MGNEIYKDYTCLAVRTEAPFRGDVPIDPQVSRLLHGAVGLVTETGELLEVAAKSPLDEPHLCEEIGDLCWYAALLSDVAQVSFPSLVNRTFQRPHPQWLTASLSLMEPARFDVVLRGTGLIVRGAGLILDQCKRVIYYGLDPKVMDVESINAGIQTAVDGIVTVAHSGVSQSLEEICTRNIRKLAVRYPDKFTDAKAVQRDLAAERAVLEGTPVAVEVPRDAFITVPFPEPTDEQRSALWSFGIPGTNQRASLQLVFSWPSAIAAVSVPGAESPKEAAEVQPVA